MGREVGGGIEMGKTCEPKAFSFQCMTKFTTKKKKKWTSRININGFKVMQLHFSLQTLSTFLLQTSFVSFYEILPTRIFVGVKLRDRKIKIGVIVEVDKYYV